MAGNVYWVSTIASNWNNTANWSLSSGGTGGAPIPGLGDSVFYDASGTGSCTVDAIIGITTLSVVNYNNAIFQNGYAITATEMSLFDGTISGTGTIHCQGILSVGSNFVFSDQTLSMDGTVNQLLNYQSGCILPSLVVDTTATVTFDGTGPILIGGDFTLMDGTVNTNGLDIQVGV